MKRLLPAALIILVSLRISGQVPVGSWSDHLRYNTARNVAVTPGKVFASTGTSLLVYDREFGELKKLSKVNGLSGTGISAIAWSGEKEVLAVAYLNSDLDLIYNSSVYNIPDIALKSLSVEKRINRIRMSGHFAFLAASFGIVVVDLSGKEIYDTWHPGPDSEYNEVFDIAFGEGKIYAATEEGLWQASMTGQGLGYFGNWEQVNPAFKCNHIVCSGGSLYFNVPGPDNNSDQVYAIKSGGSLSAFMEGGVNVSFDNAPDGFTITSSGILRYFRSDGTLIRNISSYGWGTPDMSEGLVDGTDLWLADQKYGLVRGSGMSEFSILALPGPASDSATGISSSGGKTVICAGGTDDNWQGLGHQFMASVNAESRFENIVKNNFSDAMRCCFDPADNSHFFISSWGNGLIECRNNTVTAHYDETNSPLQSATGTSGGVKVCGLAMDSGRNLWITVSGVPGSIRVLKPDGSWISFPVSINSPIAGDIIHAKNGQIWIVLPLGYGLFILDDNNTLELFTDDKYTKLTIKDSDGNIIPSAFSIAHDLDGNIWVGTDHGPVVYYLNSQNTDDDIRCSRIKVPREDGSGLADYLLGTETITSIGVDGANRKWLGTLNSGAYLLSADGTKMLKNYNTGNSPLFSDHITSLAVDDLSGEVWLGTSAGVLSLRETATAGGEEFGKVYSFPNPVRETFTGNVTITGLMRDTNVKITDVSGNLVYETVSAGGQASWDLTTYTGSRVTTGVYLVFCAASDGSQSCVTKILVIGR
jgi:hypothetical protein